MSYVDDNLMTNETVVYKAKLHKILFLMPVILALIFISAAIIVLGTHKEWGTGTLHLIISLGLITLSIVIVLVPLIRYHTSEFAVTNKRVIVKLGLIRRDTIEMLLQKIEAVGVDQTVLGRVLDYGTIKLVGTGGTQEAFDNIASPLQFRRFIQEQIDSKTSLTMPS